MGDAGYAAKVVATTVKHSTGPVSVKLRAVDADKKADWISFVKGLEDAGASWLCLHPRTAEQKRRGRADWSQFAELRKAVSVPIIGNGDMQTADDVMELLRDGQCDMVMVGRALTARPWLFWQIGEILGWPAPEGKVYPAPKNSEEEGVEYGRSLFRLLQLMSESFPEAMALRKFNFHIKTGCVWLPFGHYLYGQMSRAKNIDDAFVVLDRFFSSPQLMHQRTDLRQ